MELSSSSSFSSQVAIVTGGSRGIGRGIAFALARSSMQVAVVARSAEDLTETVEAIDGFGGRAMAVVADVSNDAVVRWLVHQVEDKLGPVDLLVNNAGLAEPLGPIATADPGAWWHCFEVNLKASFLCTQAVLPGMLARGQGRIIHVASGAGTFALPNLSAYAISKTALIRFSETLAVECGAAGIRSFSISPGTVRTAMAEVLMNHPRAEEWFPWFAQTIEAGRDVASDRSAELVLKLASGRYDELSGCFLHIEDDLETLLSRATEIRSGRLYSLQLSKVQ